jgi:hypothetical protein
VQSYQAEHGAAQAAELRHARIQQLQQCVAAWAQRSLSAVEQLDVDLRHDLEQLYELSAAHSRESQAAIAHPRATTGAKGESALRSAQTQGARR